MTNQSMAWYLHLHRHHRRHSLPHPHNNVFRIFMSVISHLKVFYVSSVEVRISVFSEKLMNDQSQTSIPTPDLSHLKSADYEQVNSKLKNLMYLN